MRTITDRRRCKSIPTYCCSCSTRVSFRLRVGLETPSVPCTPDPRLRGRPWRSTTDTDITDPPQLGAPARTAGTRSRKSGAALLHDISYAAGRSDGDGGQNDRASRDISLGSHMAATVAARLSLSTRTRAVGTELSVRSAGRVSDGTSPWRTRSNRAVDRAAPGRAGLRCLVCFFCWASDQPSSM